MASVEDLESFELVSFIPTSQEVQRLVQQYQLLVHRLDHYPRSEERTRIITEVFTEVGSLILYGWNEVRSQGKFDYLECECDAYTAGKTSCVDSCTVL